MQASDDATLRRLVEERPRSCGCGSSVNGKPAATGGRKSTINWRLAAGRAVGHAQLRREFAAAVRGANDTQLTARPSAEAGS